LKNDPLSPRKMYRKGWLILLILVSIMQVTACIPQQTGPAPEANMPNPASVHCEQNGGKLDLRLDASGGTSGVCVFPDGSECEEWAYFRGECKPGNTWIAPEPPPTADAELAGDGCRIYQNEKLGYSFHYPADAQIITNDEPLKSFSIIGPMVVGESWPQFTISHPGDREDYRPPENAVLDKWLMEHALLSGIRQPDTLIAGTIAIHERHDRSPQSYAYDRYFFVIKGQLYMIVIGHTAEREDWDLYNHFLQSIQFEM
jgi:putative hemolysin